MEQVHRCVVDQVRRGTGASWIRCVVNQVCRGSGASWIRCVVDQVCRGDNYIRSAELLPGHGNKTHYRDKLSTICIRRTVIVTDVWTFR